jgi:glycosyltransferase involved in cell wall biosynthesis
MNVVFLEPCSTGHRMRYLGHLVREAASRGHHVTIGTTEEARVSQAFQEFVSASEHPELFLAPPVGVKRVTPLQAQIYNWCGSTFASIKANRAVDLVFVPYLNYIEKLIAIKGSPFGGIPWSGIVMKESFHHHRLGLRPDAQQFSWIREKLFLRLLSNKDLRSVITIDETLPEHVKRFRQHSKLVYVPDPADVNEPIERRAACNRLGLSPEPFYLLCYGHLDDRKGVIEMLDSLCSQSQLQGVTIIIAGRREPGVDRLIEARRLANRSGPQILNLNRFITADEEQCLFSLANAVWVGYKGHFGSSGILGQAAAAHAPVIACDRGLIAFTTKQHNLGICIDVANPDAIRSAVSRLLNDSQMAQTFGRAGGEFSAARTPELFSSKILDLVEQTPKVTKTAPDLQSAKPKPNILIVHNHPIHYKTMLFEALGRIRNDVHVLYVSSSSVIRNKTADLRRERYSFSVASDTAFESFAANFSAFRVIDAIRQMRPRVLVSGGYHHLAFWIAAIAAKLLGAKVVLWYESNEFDHKRVFWKEFIKRTFLKMCDFAQVYGTSNKEYLVKLGLRDNQISIKMAVVDVPRFKNIEPRIGTRPQRTLIYIGRLSPEKNLCRLIEAVHTMNRKNSERPISLRIVGYGPQERELKTLVARLNMQECVEFCGAKSQEELRGVFAEGDALILPSTREPWGLTILEAMCAGLPVIASDHCGCTKDVVLPDNGWQFKAHCLDSLCKALEQFQNADVAELAAMGTAGRAIGIQYNADNSAMRTSQLLTHILGDDRGLLNDEHSQARFIFSR